MCNKDAPLESNHRRCAVTFRITGCNAVSNYNCSLCVAYIYLFNKTGEILHSLPAIKSNHNTTDQQTLWIPVREHKAMCATVCPRVLMLNDSPGSAPPRSCSKLASGRSSRASSLHTRAPQLALNTPAPMTNLRTNECKNVFQLLWVTVQNIIFHFM